MVSTAGDGTVRVAALSLTADGGHCGTQYARSRLSRSYRFVSYVVVPTRTHGDNDDRFVAKDMMPSGPPRAAGCLPPSQSLQPIDDRSLK